MPPELLELIEKIRKVAAKETVFERGLDISDIHGGNYDDAFYAGCDDGEISFARELLAIIED